MSFVLNVAVSAMLLFACALAVQVYFSATRVFGFGLAAATSLAPYGALVAAGTVPAAPALAAAFGIAAASGIVLAYELTVAARLRSRGTPEWGQLLASLGFYIIVQNCLSIAFGDQPRQWLPGAALPAADGFPAQLTRARVVVLVAASALGAGVLLLVQRTGWGLRFRGVASNPELMLILGVRPERVRGASAGVAAVAAAAAGLLAGLDSDMTPGSGLPLFLGGVAVAILSGIGSYTWLGVGAVTLAALQQATARFLDANWAEGVTYVTLVALLIWKPRGLGGDRIKAVEV